MWQWLLIERARSPSSPFPGKVCRIFLIWWPVPRRLAILTVRLSFSPSGGEVALFGFAATSDTWRVVGFINRSQVAADFSLPARNLRKPTLASVGGGGWTRSAIRRLDRSFYAEEVQIYFQHVRRYASFRRFDLQVVVELQLPLLWWLEK